MPLGGSRLRMVGRYALQHEIAAGGMASVYLGKMCGPVGFSPIVAIKCMHPQYAKDPEFVRMFLDEARLAGRIRHPNVVPVLDVHAEGDELFLVLEYVHGESLARLFQASRKAGSLPSPEIASAIVRDVLHGLHAAHEAKNERGEPLGIVHRDVSPQNVLVGADGVARVLDFGVAKATGRVTTTRDGQVKGKFAYMAPEQLRGEDVNRQADVYSVSVILWETLTGQRLFQGENEGHVVERVLFGTLSPPRALRPEVPAAMEAVVMRGLSRERTDRFASAKEMAIALAAAVQPASTPEVGEWVEARAIDALEKRAELVRAVESFVVPAEATPSPDGATMPAPQLPPPPQPAATAPAPRSRLRLLWVVGAAAAAALAIGLGLRTRATGAATPISAQPVALPEVSAPPSAPVAPIAAAADSSTAPPIASARPDTQPSPPPAATVRPSRSAKHGAKAPSGPGSAACARRNADGEIEFDMECLRATHAAP
jgi:eukaryotic-like serine/threonine-protein kinase